MKNRYIFLTTDGLTYPPGDADYGDDIENCQMLGIASGKNRQNALRNLLKENSWIIEAGFDPDKIFGYESAEK